MKKSFKEAVTIITGGASGIGKELARQLAKSGSRVIIVDRNGTAGAETVREFERDELTVAFKQVDMIDEPSVREMVREVITDYGRLDIMINGAGIFMGGEFRDSPIADWHKVATNNILSVMNGTHHAYQAMVEQGYGAIVNIGSAAGLFPVPAMGIYGSSKFAVVGMSVALRNEAKDLGVNVSVVCPTVVNTPLYDTATYHNVRIKELLRARGTLQTSETAAERILKGMSKNRGVIHTSFSTKFAWLVYRIVPGVYHFFSQRVVRKYRRNYRTES